MKRMISFMITVVLCIGLFAGCGGKQPHILPTISGTWEHEQTEDTASDPTWQTTAPTQAQSADIRFDWWDGEWYGWWCMFDTQGRFVSLEDYAWDVCATIDVADGEPFGHIRIWDYNLFEFGTLVNCNVRFAESGDPRGIMVSQQGSFFDSGADWQNSSILGNPCQISEGEWQVDPTDSVVSHFENMVEINGQYMDPDNSADAFAYKIYLRPWGTRWEDVQTGDISGCMYDDMMPMCYSEWYLPLLEKGESMMPGSFAQGQEILNDDPSGEYADLPEYDPLEGADVT